MGDILDDLLKATGKVVAAPVRIVNLPLKAIDRAAELDVSEPLEEIADDIEDIFD